MKNLVVKRDDESAYVTYIKRVITKENSNFMALFQGPSGSGKTWSAITAAKMIDPEWDVDKMLVFDFRQLMTLINDEEFKKRKVKVIIFDEPQISINSRSWQSMTNKLMNYLTSTFRHQNIVLFFCCPYRDFLDSASMKMIHCVFEMKNIKKKEGVAVVRPKFQQYNSMMKKTYEHSLYVKRDSRVRKMMYWHVPKPDADDIEIYEMNKGKFTANLNREIELKLNEFHSKEAEEGRDKRKELTDIQERTMNAIALYDSQNEAAAFLGVDASTVSTNKKAAQKKGYTVAEFRRLLKKDVPLPERG